MQTGEVGDNRRGRDRQAKRHHSDAQLLVRVTRWHDFYMVVVSPMGHMLRCPEGTHGQPRMVVTCKYGGRQSLTNRFSS